MEVARDVAYTREFFFKGHNELNTGGGESRVEENNTRRRISQGGE